MWELDCEESWAPKNWCFWTVVLEKTLESPLDCKEIQPVHSEWDQPWVFSGRNDAKAETPVLWPPHVKRLTHWKRLWCWEGLGAGGEGDDSGWDGWMASLTRWMWVWVNSGSWCWTGRPGMLQFMESQRVGHDSMTALTVLILNLLFPFGYSNPHFYPQPRTSPWLLTHVSNIHQHLHISDQSQIPCIQNCMHAHFF